MATHHFEPEIFYYTFESHEPALRIASGDTVVAETRDALGNDAKRNPLPESMKHKSSGTRLKESNPVLGPIYLEEAHAGDLLEVDGAENGEAHAGDLLAIHIRKIRLNRDFAISKQSAYFGSLTGEGPGRRLLYNAPIQDIWSEWRLDLERNVGILELPESRLKRVEAPLKPFIGSIGVAPRFGRVETTLTPGEFGGNMDYMETHEGTTLYLPVWVDGAHLAFGDIHALQGDGEVNGTALEVTAEVTLQIEVLEGRDAPWPERTRAEWPRLETDSHIMAIGCTRPLMDCVRLAQMELLHWLVEEYGFQREECWQLMAQVSSMRIGNVVDPLYAVAARFPKGYLPD